MVTIPATIGAKVLNIGKKRAKMMAFPPYRSKNSCDSVQCLLKTNILLFEYSK